MKTSSASDGIVCTRPVVPRMSRRRRRRRAATMPSGSAEEDGAAEREPHERAGARRCARAMRRTTPSAGDGAARPSWSRGEVGGDARLGHLVALGARVHRDHVGGGDGADQARERARAPAPAACRGSTSTASYSVKWSQIVGEQRRLVVADLGVGGVGVDDVERAAGEPAPGEIVVEPAHVASAAGGSARAAPASRRRARGTPRRSRGAARDAPTDRRCAAGAAARPRRG